MDYEIIDNFLSDEDFTRLQHLFYNYDFPWHYTAFANVNQTKWSPPMVDLTEHLTDGDSHYPKEFARGFYHTFKCRSQQNNELSKEHRHYDILKPILDKLNIDNNLLRLKANLYPSSENIIEHATHCDDAIKHTGALLSINTCNGYTILNDGTKVDSVANRCLIFDSSLPHASTTCTNDSVRINVNVNFL